jgi:transposase InsO family protein
MSVRRFGAGGIRSARRTRPARPGLGDPARRGHYPGSQSTSCRLLRAAGETRERRRQAVHPAAVKPELLAAGPSQVWSWDITKLHGPAKWTYGCLYVILDIHSRYVTGWMLAAREPAALAEKLIAATCAKQGIARGQLTIHADRGSSMNLPAGRVPARRPRRHPVALPAARQQRQPVLRGPVQDPEIPARVPGPVRLEPGRPGALPGVPGLV